MGASKRQIYARVIIPAILPGMLIVLRMNLFAAWMVVLIAESTGVGYGLGQVIMLARNTFNPSLVFFTIAVIGVLGFAVRLRDCGCCRDVSCIGCRKARRHCVASNPGAFVRWISEASSSTSCTMWRMTLRLSALRGHP